MNPKRYIAVLCIVLCSQLSAQAQDIDAELSKLAEKLAAQIEGHGTKKVSVVDFTGIQGTADDLGKYIADQLTVDLVMNKRNFSVLDRANLKTILAEHKLAAEGLVDPENAKKFAMLAGVDALILGTSTPKGQGVTVTAKVIAIDTSEIIAAGRAQFTKTQAVDKLQDPVIKKTQDADDTEKVTKKLGDLQVGLQSLHVLNGNGYRLTMSLSNQSQRRSIWVAVRGGMFGTSQPILTSPNGTECVFRKISGIPATLYQNNGFAEATEIQPGNSIPVTMNFSPAYSGHQISLGQCTVQMEFLV
jgi:TolB-like protein